MHGGAAAQVLNWTVLVYWPFIGLLWSGVGCRDSRGEWGGLQDGSPSISLTYKWNPAVEKKSVV